MVDEAKKAENASQDSGNGESSTPAAPSSEAPARRRSIPPPPPTGGQSVHLALGMQLMQQSSFESLEPRIQDRLIDLADELDRRQYDYYCRGLDQQGEQYRQTLQDTADVRKQGVVALSVLAGLTIVFGGGAVLYLFSKEEYEQGFTLLMAGLGILGAFLGGSGLPGFLRSFVRRSPNGG